MLFIPPKDVVARDGQSIVASLVEEIHREVHMSQMSKSRYVNRQRSLLTCIDHGKAKLERVALLRGLYLRHCERMTPLQKICSASISEVIKTAARLFNELMLSRPEMQESGAKVCVSASPAFLDYIVSKLACLCVVCY